MKQDLEEMLGFGLDLEFGVSSQAATAYIDDFYEIKKQLFGKIKSLLCH